jgi:hypothetical protein
MIDATPKARDIFLGYVRGGYTLTAAVAEYVDNAIEQAVLTGRATESTVRISVGAISPKIAIEIDDDAGGCPRDQASKFVQPGLSGVSPEASAISRFGMGGKAAGLSIADKVIVISRSQGETGWRVILDREEILQKADWKFEVTGFPKDVDLPEGHTRVILLTSDTAAHAAYPARYLREFTERYAYLDKDARPKIFVGETAIQTKDPVEELLTEQEAPGGCGPLTFALTKSYPITVHGKRQLGNVDFRMTVGLVPQGTAGAQYGAQVYCNGRLLVRYSKIGLIADEFEAREKHPASIEVWLRSIIQIRGPSEAMPWTNRKDNLDVSSPSFKDLEGFAKKSYDTYIERSLGEARRAMKEQVGQKQLPTVRDLLVWAYREKIRAGKLKPGTLRSYIGSSSAFQEALKPASEEEEVPEPPKKIDEVTLSANIEKWKVDKMRRLIQQKLGKPVVRNTDIVRLSVDHYLRCVGGEPADADEE